MNAVITQSEFEAEFAALCQAIHDAELMAGMCDVDGRLIDTPSADSTLADDWLLMLLRGSAIVAQALKTAAAGWQHDDAPAAQELIPGLFVLPIPQVHRRKRLGYTLIFIPTVDLPTSEQLQHAAQAAQLDFAVITQRLADRNLVAPTEVNRIAALALSLCLSHRRLADVAETMDSVGQQLAESYEEISLLYSMSQKMTVVQRPSQFILEACRGLLETLPFRWVGVQFAENVDSLPSLAGRLLSTGAIQVDDKKLHQLGPTALSAVPIDSPLVVDTQDNPKFAHLKPLGNPVLLFPISRGDRTIGVMIAADKEGSDQAATSADLKLLGATATHTGIFLENAALYEDMEAMFLGTLEAITASIDAKDRYTCGHSQRVAHLSQQLAIAIGLDEESVSHVHVTGLMHDVGKIGVPESVLSKPGRLSDEEFDRIKEHPEIGYGILKDIPQLKHVLPGVLHHHERWDGGGYPHGLTGNDIPLVARLIALADSFDAMSSTRTYRSARDRDWVIEEIKRSAGTQFDPELARIFVNLDFREFDRMVAEHRAGRPDIQGEAA